MDVCLLLQLQVWIDVHDFGIATAPVDRWTYVYYCNYKCGQLDMILLLQPHMWTDWHDFVVATTISYQSNVVGYAV